MVQKSRIGMLKKKREKYIVFGIVVSILCLLIPIDIVKIICAITLAFCVFMVRVLERNIKRLIKMKENKEVVKLQLKCKEVIGYIENLYLSNGFSADIEENYVIAEIYSKLKECIDVRAYRNFLKELNLRFECIIDFMEMRKQWSYEDNNKFEPDGKKTLVDCLNILGVAVDIRDKAIIHKAYRKLMMKYHPDKNKSKDAEMKAREINEAHDLITKKYIVS